MDWNIELKQIVSESYPQIQLLFTYKSFSMIVSHFRFKDTQPLMSKSNLSYKYTCECCPAFYIGKTNRQLVVHIFEHSGVYARTGKTFKNRPQSDIFDHSEECNAHIKPENVKILDTLQTENGLLLLESLHQKTKKPLIGKQQQSTPYEL